MPSLTRFWWSGSTVLARLACLIPCPTVQSLYPHSVTNVSPLSASFYVTSKANTMSMQLELQSSAFLRTCAHCQVLFNIRISGRQCRRAAHSPGPALWGAAPPQRHILPIIFISWTGSRSVPPSTAPPSPGIVDLLSHLPGLSAIIPWQVGPQSRPFHRTCVLGSGPTTAAC